MRLRASPSIVRVVERGVRRNIRIDRRSCKAVGVWNEGVRSLIVAGRRRGRVMSLMRCACLFFSRDLLDCMLVALLYELIPSDGE